VAIVVEKCELCEWIIFSGVERCNMGCGEAWILWTDRTCLAKRREGTIPVNVVPKAVSMIKGGLVRAVADDKSRGMDVRETQSTSRRRR